MTKGFQLKFLHFSPKGSAAERVPATAVPYGAVVLGLLLSGCWNTEMPSVSELRPPGSVDALFLQAANTAFLSASQQYHYFLFPPFNSRAFSYLRTTSAGERDR